MAERVGFEPTCPCGQDAFEAPPLRPLRYLSVYWRARVAFGDFAPPARLSSLHSARASSLAPLRSRLAIAVATGDWQLFCAPLLKEVLHHGATVFLEHSPDRFNPMVERRVFVRAHR